MGNWHIIALLFKGEAKFGKSGRVWLIGIKFWIDLVYHMSRSVHSAGRKPVYKVRWDSLFKYGNVIMLQFHKFYGSLQKYGDKISWKQKKMKIFFVSYSLKLQCCQFTNFNSPLKNHGYWELYYIASTVMVNSIFNY